MYKIGDLKDTPKDALLLTVDALGLYPSMSQEAGLQTLKDVLEQRKDKKVLKNQLLKMEAFLLKNNYFEFNVEVKHQISGTAISTKFAPAYASIFIDEIDTNFLDTQEFLLFCLCFGIVSIYRCFLYLDMCERKHFNNYHSNIKFTHEFNKGSIPLLDWG